MEKCSEYLIIITFGYSFFASSVNHPLDFWRLFPGLADILSLFFFGEATGPEKRKDPANQQILAPIDGATAIYALISLFSY